MDHGKSLISCRENIHLLQPHGGRGRAKTLAKGTAGKTLPVLIRQAGCCEIAISLVIEVGCAIRFIVAFALVTDEREECLYLSAA